MDVTIFNNISRIIERESKSTTYKFALLRGLVDIIQENSPFISFKGDRVYFPMGLLVEKWMLYYYPILESPTRIPQIYGEAKLAFENSFKKIIAEYNKFGGYSVFFNDLKHKGIPQNLRTDFIKLIKNIKDTIVKQPMRYIGSSINKSYYSIFNYKSDSEKKKSSLSNLEFLINNFGSFSIPIDYYEALKLLGSFISGKDSIIIKWAEFSINASSNNLSLEKIVNEILKNPVTERDVEESKKIYSRILDKEGKVYCVWTGKEISTYDIDHLIPFSIWKNNDLWNLLPSQARINNKKRNKIPSVSVIEKQKDLIIHYWELVNMFQQERFQQEIKITLLGSTTFSDWREKSIEQLQNICGYLITTRGYEEWTV